MKKFLDKLDKFEKGLSSLIEMIDFDSSFDNSLEKLDEAIRDSIIKKFEHTFELALKTIREYLKKEGYEEFNSPRKILKQAFEINLITDEEIWSNMLEARNSTIYRYDESQAIFYEDVIKKKYILVLKSLLKEFKDE